MNCRFDILKIQNDSFCWDYQTWRKSCSLWRHELDSCYGKKVLELGSDENPGLSLLFVTLGARVVCSSVKNTTDEKRKMHKTYGVDHCIDYSIVDATDIPHHEEFDIICFKSMLGGICRDNNELAKKTLDSCYNALKPGGSLLFCENLEGTWFHRIARSLFSKAYKNNWKYFRSLEMISLLQNWCDVSASTFGFSAVFFASNRVKNFFAAADTFIFDKFLPHDSKYVIAIIARKPMP